MLPPYRTRLWIGGQWSTGEAGTHEVRAPWDGEVVTVCEQASEAQVDAALEFAARARRVVAASSSGERRAALLQLADGLGRRAEEISERICAEAGKPITLARAEVSRSIQTVLAAASELIHFGGATPPVDFAPHAQGMEAETRRVAAGVVVGVVPFNFPLNLGMHKLAPALAVGTPIVVKSPPQAPGALAIVAELVEQTALPLGAMQLVSCHNDVAQTLCSDPRAAVVSFTGSARVGWLLKAAVRGRVVLELGGNAAALVAADADIAHAARRIADAAYAYAGQVCIKTQRVIVEESVYQQFREAFLSEVRAIACGDPRQASTRSGPVIDDVAAARIDAWVEEAQSAGGAVQCGGPRSGRMFPLTVLEHCPLHVRAWREEIFGPVACIQPARNYEEAVALANDSEYGLQAALFTNDLKRVRSAYRELEVGAVIVNDATSFRVDHLPYGGVKGSGLGREGVRRAMEDYTEERMLVTRSSW